MNYKRASEIVSHEKICDVYYGEKAVWIQEVENNMARIGFMDGSNEKSVKIEDLYE